MRVHALVGIFLIPVLYVVFQWLREQVKGLHRAKPSPVIRLPPNNSRLAAREMKRGRRIAELGLSAAIAMRLLPARSFLIRRDHAAPGPRGVFAVTASGIAHTTDIDGPAAWLRLA